HSLHRQVVALDRRREERTASERSCGVGARVSHRHVLVDWLQRLTAPPSHRARAGVRPLHGARVAARRVFRRRHQRRRGRPLAGSEVPRTCRERGDASQHRARPAEDTRAHHGDGEVMRPTRTMLCGAALLSVSVTVLLAQQVRDAPAAPAPISGTARIVGTVVYDDAQPVPVRRAAVTVTNAENNRAVRTYTDDAGRFALTRLPAGRYLLSAL